MLAIGGKRTFGVELLIPESIDFSRILPQKS
jgi:hypothetical protein